MRHKLLWFGSRDGVGGAGVMVKKKVMELGRMSDRVMAVVLVFEDIVLKLICAYIGQSGRSLEAKEIFYYELKGELDMHNVDNLIVVG